MNEVADRYAEALFSLACENNRVREMKEEADSLLTVIKENPELTVFFRAVKVTAEEKKALITKVFGEEYSKDTVSFLKLLIDKGRIYYLNDMLQAVVHKANEELGIQEVTVYSARRLPKEDLDKIKAALEKKTGKEIVIENHLDEKLIAGIKVVIGNNVTDVTMRHKLDEMKSNLLKGGGQA